MIDNLFLCDIGALITDSPIIDKASSHAARIRSTKEATMRFRTIGLISILALGLLAAALPAEAQKAGKVYRIGFLADGPG